MNQKRFCEKFIGAFIIRSARQQVTKCGKTDGQHMRMTFKTIEIQKSNEIGSVLLSIVTGGSRDLKSKKNIFFTTFTEGQ